MKKVVRAIVIILLIVSLVQIWLMLRKPSMPAAEPSPEAAQSFDRKLNELILASEQGTPGEVRLTEAELNSKIQGYLRESPMAAGAATLKAATVHMEGDKLQALLTVDFKGVDLYLTLGGNLSFKDHLVKLVPSNVKVGSHPLPASLLAGRLDLSLAVPEAVSGIRVENGELVVETQ
jgi:hypothetical protein